MTDSIDVLCDKCKIPLVAPDNPKPDDMATCPKCGASDKYYKVMDEGIRQTKKFLEDRAKEIFKDI